jgi:hypothetical protein
LLAFFRLDVFNGQIYISDGLISLLCKKLKFFYPLRSSTVITSDIFHLQPGFYFAIGMPTSLWWVTFDLINGEHHVLVLLRCIEISLDIQLSIQVLGSANHVVNSKHIIPSFTWDMHNTNTWELLQRFFLDGRHVLCNNWR